MNKTHVRIADFVLIAALVAVAFLPWIFLRGKPAKSVAVVLDGKTVQTMPLDTDAEFVIDGVGKVVVRDGKVFVTDMTCPDRLCEKMGKISTDHLQLFLDGSGGNGKDKRIGKFRGVPPEPPRGNR